MKPDLHFIWPWGENKLEPKYVCPVCSQVGLVFNPEDNDLRSSSQMCVCCGFRDNPNFGKDRLEREKNWREAWLKCGAVKLYEKPDKEKREQYRRIVYEDYANYRYVLTDEQIEKHEFDDVLFTQYGFVNNSDSSRKVTVRCEDGRNWQFEYKTNTLFYLDDVDKFFAVGEEPERDRYYLFASEYLTKKSSGDRQYRGGFIGFVPDLFGGFYSLDDECVLTGLDDKKYYFNLEKE